MLNFFKEIMKSYENCIFYHFSAFGEVQVANWLPWGRQGSNYLKQSIPWLLMNWWHHQPQYRPSYPRIFQFQHQNGKELYASETKIYMGRITRFIPEAVSNQIFIYTWMHVGDWLQMDHGQIDRQKDRLGWPQYPWKVNGYTRIKQSNIFCLHLGCIIHVQDHLWLATAGESHCTLGWSWWTACLCLLQDHMLAIQGLQHALYV